MPVTVGISAEQTVVRGVMLSFPAQPNEGPTVLREVEQPVGESVAASVAATFDALASAAAGTPIDDVAIAYRTAAERRAVVSQLPAQSGQSPTLVSTKAALLALLGDLPEPAKYGTVLMLEVAPANTSYLVVGPRRDEILASDSWSLSVLDAGTADQAAKRIRPALDAAGMDPSAVVLCGSSAGDPDIAAALRRALDKPVIAGPDFVYAAAYGTALVAASRFRNATVVEAPAAPRRRTRRALAIAAAVATVLGGVAIAILAMREDRPLSTSPTPASAAAVPWKASTTSANPEPVPPPVEVPDPPPAPAHAPPVAVPEETAAPQTAAPPRPAPPATVATPTDTYLFPGEAPPPPWNAPPEVVHAWWDNHAKLVRHWLHGR